jgi:glycosyltransferase involved in cell wall biosynthesis
MEKVKISIAMATFNGSMHIIEQLKSFSNQTLKPDEIVINDDNSTDDTVDLIRKFAKSAPFDIILNINDQNLGFSGNFNKALSNTSGNLVFLSDQDDVWFSNKIEYMVNLAKKNPNYFIYMNDALLTDEFLNPANLSTYDQIRSGGFTDSSYVMGCCCMIRREFLSFALPIPISMKAHDIWLVKIADGLNSKLIDLKILQYYRRHGKNESQFIGNRLQKISEFSVLWQNLKFVINPNSNEKFSQNLDHEQFFIDELKRILPNVPSPFVDGFQNFIENELVKIELARVRLSIRESSIFLRFVRAFKLYFSGYPKNTRLKNMIRDIFG